MIVTENRLDDWVGGDARDAQGTIVELVERLVSASCPRPKERRFPLGDSITQRGPDGVLDTEVPYDPYVPKGRSYWEIGTGGNPREKATTDYETRTKAIPQGVRKESSFIFVTPLSGAHHWPYTYDKNGQCTWIQERRDLGEWHSISVIDGSKLVDWMHRFSGVELWMAAKMNMRTQQIETLDQRWSLMRTYGEPPPLTPDIFLANRAAILPAFEAIFNGTSHRLTLQSHFTGQTADVVSAWIETLDRDRKIEYSGRCIVISKTDLRSLIDSLMEPHVLVVNMHVEDLGDEGPELVQRIRHGRHALIIGGAPGGTPDPTRITLPDPRGHHIREALIQAGYPEEQARSIAQRCDGDLPSLLRLLQKVSELPEWAQRTAASDLAVAQFLGAWKEQVESDKAAVEAVVGKAYGEWAGRLRIIANSPDTPLIQNNGTWRIVARYEVWHILGNLISDGDLDRFKTTCVAVLRELDPQFDLPPDERYAASVHGKILKHSNVLRKGLSETLALLGSYPQALSSCSEGKAESTAVLAVRELLAGADWLIWASLNDLLPLLAEASPREFLSAVETALVAEPCPFDSVFKQEGSGFFGRNYTTGLLWALETLAWDPDCLTRVVIVLGGIAHRDPGGNWANRPANSLFTILLPWKPQTCASVQQRIVAVETLLKEMPDVGWNLLLNVLPSTSQMSMGTRKPEWREIIPADQPANTTHGDYWQQIYKYAELALSYAKHDKSKLIALIERLQDLPDTAGEQLLAHLASPEVHALPEKDRINVWTELESIISKHRKYRDAEWAMDSARMEKLSSISDSLAPQSPFYRYQRLFTDRDFDLYEEKGNWEKQQKDLENRRENAANQVYAEGGLAAILSFALAVESPWQVGNAFGIAGSTNVDREILPALLQSAEKHLSLFAGGFVKGRFFQAKWEWINGIDFTHWSPFQIGVFLSYLPFTPMTWDQATRLLGHDESPYWLQTSANAHETLEKIEYGVNRLVEYGRPNAAARCLAIILFKKKTIDLGLAVKVLNAGVESSEPQNALDVHSIIEVINALQSDPNTDVDDLMRIEWVYLPLLDEHRGASPRFLGRRLAEDPAFFCELIRLVFKSEKDLNQEIIVNDQQRARANNAFHLLSEWKRPPGTMRDGTFSDDALIEWIGKAKEICEQSGHLTIAMQRIGQILIHAPSDPSGLWLHRSVAEVLNSKDADHMRIGFRIELFNSRGVSTFSRGQEEKEIAASYRERAKQVDEHGFYRLAETLRQLATEYEHMAKHEAREDPLDDI